MTRRRGEVEAIEARPGRGIACAARCGMSDDDGVMSHGVRSSSSGREILGNLIFEEASGRGSVFLVIELGTGIQNRLTNSVIKVTTSLDLQAHGSDRAQLRR